MADPDTCHHRSVRQTQTPVNTGQCSRPRHLATPVSTADPDACQHQSVRQTQTPVNSSQYGRPRHLSTPVSTADPDTCQHQSVWQTQTPVKNEQSTPVSMTDTCLPVSHGEEAEKRAGPGADMSLARCKVHTALTRCNADTRP